MSTEGDPLARVLRGRQRIGILDGGQSTHLEDLGFDLSFPLWSASLLVQSSQKNREAVRQIHSDYIAAGAQIIGTLTYQVSELACRIAGWSVERQRTEVPLLIQEALQLASDAVAGLPQDARPLVSLSLGPYGAALANGSEYTGDYRGASFTELVAFHKHRLSQTMSCASASAIDIFAFETIPRLDEAEAILQALEGLSQERKAAHRPPAYLSFVFPPDCDGRLPWQASRPVDVIDLLSRHASLANSWPVLGVGVNCTKLALMDRVVKELNTAAGNYGTQSALFLYPDGGLVWDAVARQWSHPEAIAPAHAADGTGCSSWSRQLWSLAEESMAHWKSVWVGGCCKTGPTEIKELRSLRGI